MDDSQFLREAAAVTNTELTWQRQGRSERWRKRSFAAIFDPKGTYRGDVADVLRNACTACGSEVGERHVTLDNGGPVEWAGARCAHAMIVHHLIRMPPLVSSAMGHAAERNEPVRRAAGATNKSFNRRETMIRKPAGAISRKKEQ